MGNLGDILDLLRSMGTILAAVFYVAIVLWTFKDSRKRLDDPILVATATAVSMLPIVGVFVYMLLRPSEYLADVRERELEIRMMEQELGRQERCPYCKSHIEGDYLSCPVCATKLRSSCTGCQRPLDPRWVICPFCETEAPDTGHSEDRGRRGRRSRPEARPARSGAGTERKAPRERSSTAATRSSKERSERSSAERGGASRSASSRSGSTRSARSTSVAEKSARAERSESKRSSNSTDATVKTEPFDKSPKK